MNDPRQPLQPGEIPGPDEFPETDPAIPNEDPYDVPKEPETDPGEQPEMPDDPTPEPEIPGDLPSEIPPRILN